MGVPVKLDGSLLVIAGLVAWVYVDIFSSGSRAPEGGLLLGLGALLAAVGFFASLLAHELGHAVTSERLGMPVRGITLFMLGGFTETITEAKRPRDDFLVVVLGPILSVVMGVLFWLLLFLNPPAPLDSVAAFLAGGNVLLAIFNLVPGYPLDGGRLLRAILWGVTGRPHAATRWAARIGQGFALLVIGYGLWILATSGGGFDGIWEILLGGFLLRGARQGHQRAQSRERLAGQTVRSVMGTAPPALDPAMSLAAALEIVQERPSLLWPVGEPLIGGLTLQQIDAVEDVRWLDVTVGEQALPLGGISMPADAPLDEAVRHLLESPVQMVLIVEHGRAVGLLTASLLGLTDT